MGQGRRRRGHALASAGQRPVRRASLRLRRSRPAALCPRRLRLAGPRLQGFLAGQGRRHVRRRGWVSAAAWHVRAPCSGRPRSTARRPRGSGTTAARHALAPCSGRLRSKAHRLRGSGDHHCPPPAGAPLRPAEVDGTPSAGVRDHRSPARAGAPLWPAKVEGAPAAGVGGPPLPATRGRPAQARRGRRRACRGGRGLPQPGTRGRPRWGLPRSRASTRLKREGR